MSNPSEDRNISPPLSLNGEAGFPEASETAEPFREDQPVLTTGANGSSVKQDSAIALKCIRCGAKLKIREEHIECLQCSAQWPVIRGIPRFFEAQDYYWGEINRKDAGALLASARKGSWESSIKAHVERPDLQDYYLDLQRASWLALLGLNSTAVALDIGCGYGAITHSLALSVGQVYSIEAVPERIEFTQERLRQEKIANVSLFQASAVALPFFEKSFDLIVANGILEWIGEWDLEGSPRAAQLKFLSSLQRLLKKDGVLVIGIENRFGLPAFRGQLDHSGQPYTSIMPRRMATWMLRHCSKGGQYAFLTPNSKREYRTYTYSSRGYRKLLKESGFEKASLYWAQPGYNRPHRLIPLDATRLAAERYRDLQKSYGTVRRVPWHGKAKIALARLYPLFAHEFVIVGLKSGKRKKKPELWFRSTLAQGASAERGNFSGDGKLLYAAYTRPFCNRSILQFWSPVVGRIHAVAKASCRNGVGTADNIGIEFRNLGRVRERLLQYPELAVGAPKPIDCIHDGNNVYALESLAKGTQFVQLVNRERYSGNFEQIQKDFAPLVRMSVELSKALRTLQDVSPIDAAWYRLPDEVSGDTSWSDWVRRESYTFLNRAAEEKPHGSSMATL